MTEEKIEIEVVLGQANFAESRHHFLALQLNQEAKVCYTQGGASVAKQ